MEFHVVSLDITSKTKYLLNNNNKNSAIKAQYLFKIINTNIIHNTF